MTLCNMIFCAMTGPAPCQVMAQKIMLQRVINYDHEKELVKRTLNIKDKEEEASK